MSLLQRLKALFTDPETTTAATEQAEEYKGYRITPAPIKTDNGYRVAAQIEKEEHQHQLIRADELGDRQSCIELTLYKAKALIDQQGDRIFEQRR